LITLITKQVHLTYINYARWHDVCIRIVFLWKETGVPGGNPPVWLGDHMRRRVSNLSCSGESILTLRQSDNLL